MGKKREKGIDLGCVWLDKRAIQRRMIELEMHPPDVRSTMSADTWQRILDEKDVRLDTGYWVAKQLQCGLKAILHPKSLSQISEVVPLEGVNDGLRDWKAVRPLSGQQKAANGLVYFAWQLEHRHEKSRLARGKRYELADFPTKEGKELANFLSRHGDICNAVAKVCKTTQSIDLFPTHITTVPDLKEDTWWSLDEWMSGDDLALILDGDPNSVASLPRIMKNIVEGLRVLHEVGVIYRELSPSTVIVTDRASGSVVLTDFELGKLLDGNPTVSGDWPENPYRAPEVDGKELSKRDFHVDLYSWGRIVVHATCGKLPPRGEEASCLDNSKLTPKIRKIAMACLDDDPSRRPQSAAEVLKAISRWR